jgi:hypothetical protein
MSRLTLHYSGYISKVDTKTEMHVSSCPTDCFPYSFKTNLSDSVELNKLKQQYNKYAYQFLSSPDTIIRVPSKSCPSPGALDIKNWKEYVQETITKIGQLAGSVFIIGYVSYSFRVNCLHGCMIRDENKNTYVDNECRDCQQERYIAERSWERYDGEF